MKRALDLAVAITALLLLWPVMLLCAVAIRRHLGSPVLFRQTRPGLHGRPFELLKFRSMRDALDAYGQPLPDAERLTPLGARLRRWSLDELPQLINVLRGDMSLVGPRPLLMEYLPLYSPEQARRHEVRPGITGWAQVNGRNAQTWEERFRLDVWYVDHQSLALDLRVLWMTVAKVLRREGISAAGEVGMPRFRGSGGDNSGV
jgi:sugar transferase EpsL